MTDLNNAAPVAVISPGLPDDQRRLIELDDAIAKIRTQIATADLARQRGHLSRERAELLAKSTGRRRREKLKDALIGVLRERHDPETWSGILAEAQARSEREGL